MPAAEPYYLTMHAGRWIVDMSVPLLFEPEEERERNQAEADRRNRQLDAEVAGAARKRVRKEPEHKRRWRQSPSVMVGAASVVAFAAVTAAGQAFLTAKHL
jgi:hypothetical protein